MSAKTDQQVDGLIQSNQQKHEQVSQETILRVQIAEQQLKQLIEQVAAAQQRDLAEVEARVSSTEELLDNTVQDQVKMKEQTAAQNLFVEGQLKNNELKTVTLLKKVHESDVGVKNDVNALNAAIEYVKQNQASMA